MTTRHVFSLAAVAALANAGNHSGVAPCAHDRLARAERDAALVAEELQALRAAEVRDLDNERALADLLAVIEARADELRASVAA